MSSQNNKNQIENVVIVNDFDYVQGGASKVALQTAEILSKSNINVYFFSASNLRDNDMKNIKFISTNQCEALKDKFVLRGLVNDIYNLKAKNEFKKLLSTLDNSKTIIHVHGWTKALSCSVLDISFKMNFKVVVTLHDYFSVCPNGGFFNYKKLEICKFNPLSWKCIKCNCDSRNYGFKLYRVIRHFVQNKIVGLPQKLKYAIGISELSIEVLKAHLNSNICIEKIYNPISIDNATNQQPIDWHDNQYYLYVGRINKEKGVELFCEALSELKIKGIVVGDGSEREKLEKKYPTIVFEGWKSENEVEQYMKNAKALIVPSLWYEGAPLNIFEASKIGIPIIVKDTCAGREFVDSHNTFSDLDSLKELIKNQKYRDTRVFDCKEMSFYNYFNKLIKLYNMMNELEEI